MIAIVLALLSRAAEPPPVRLELLEGRAQVATVGGITKWCGPARSREFDGAGYLESGANARLSLRWNALATARVDGPSTLEWRAPQLAEGWLVLDLLRFEQAHLEVRRGPVRLRLPGGWRVHVDQGALFMRQASNGRVELEHDAGAPLLLSLERAAGRLRPPWTVLPGARLRLEADADVPEALGASAARVLPTSTLRPRPAPRALRAPKPWSFFAWPWRSDGAAPLAIELPLATPEAGAVRATQPALDLPADCARETAPPEVDAQEPATAEGRESRLEPWRTR